MVMKGYVPLGGNRGSFFTGRRPLSGGGFERKLYQPGQPLSSQWVNQTNRFQRNFQVTGGMLENTSHGPSLRVYQRAAPAGYSNPNRYGQVTELTTTSVQISELYVYDLSDTGSPYNVASTDASPGSVTGLSSNGTYWVCVKYDKSAHTCALTAETVPPSYSATYAYFPLAELVVAGGVISAIEQWYYGGRFIIAYAA